jgi:hypothetical protein
MTADCLLRAFLYGGQEQAVTSPQAPTGRRVLREVKSDKPSPFAQGVSTAGAARRAGKGIELQAPMHSTLNSLRATALQTAEVHVDSNVHSLRETKCVRCCDGAGTQAETAKTDVSATLHAVSGPVGVTIG